MGKRVHKIRHDTETRAKIQAAHIIRRFMECVNGTIKLDSNQISAGKALLNKALPDLQAVTLDHEVEVVDSRTISSEDIAWAIAAKLAKAGQNDEDEIKTVN